MFVSLHYCIAKMCQNKFLLITFCLLSLLTFESVAFSIDNAINYTDNDYNSSNENNSHMIQSNLINANVNTAKWHGSAANDSTPPRTQITNTDEYVMRAKKTCMDSYGLVSCMKYRASKIIWMLATNGLNYFPHEYSRELRDDKRRIRLIRLGEPANIDMFGDVRSFQDDTEFVRIIKFLKRAAETFGRNHAIQLSLSGDTGARISTADNEVEGRGDKKKRKWLIILPLIILMKIAHLKMTVVTLLLGVLGLNVLLVGGTAWLIHYLKFKTLCKIHPHLVQSHSHVYDSDPADYSTFVGSSFPSSHYHTTGSSPHEISLNGYNKDWSSRKAYNGYNYLDTISKRLQ